MPQLRRTPSRLLEARRRGRAAVGGTASRISSSGSAGSGRPAAGVAGSATTRSQRPRTAGRWLTTTAVRPASAPAGWRAARPRCRRRGPRWARRAAAAGGRRAVPGRARPGAAARWTAPAPLLHRASSGAAPARRPRRRRPGGRARRPARPGAGCPRSCPHKHGSLGQPGDPLQPAVAVDRGQVGPVDGHRAGVRPPEAEQQVQQRRLPGAAGPVSPRTWPGSIVSDRPSRTGPPRPPTVTASTRTGPAPGSGTRPAPAAGAGGPARRAPASAAAVPSALSW